MESELSKRNNINPHGAPGRLLFPLLICSCVLLVDADLHPPGNLGWEAVHTVAAVVLVLGAFLVGGKGLPIYWYSIYGCIGGAIVGFIGLEPTEREIRLFMQNAPVEAMVERRFYFFVIGTTVACRLAATLRRTRCVQWVCDGLALAVAVFGPKGTRKAPIGDPHGKVE